MGLRKLFARSPFEFVSNKNDIMKNRDGFHDSSSNVGGVNILGQHHHPERRLDRFFMAVENEKRTALSSLS